LSQPPIDVMNPLAWLQAWQQALTPQASAPQSSTAQASPPQAAGLAGIPGFAAPAGVAVAPEKMLEIQNQFSQQWAALCGEATRGALAPVSDSRFAGQAWANSPAHAFMAHAYLLSARTLLQMADNVEVPDTAREQIRFAMMQWIDAMAPSNFLALNPDAQQKFISSGGESLQQGIVNLLNDLQKGRISNTDETSFEIGKSIATTEGAVVFENALFQLIQYTPITPRVHTRPLVIVPPCINKFYILDLQANNSFVRYALEQGISVYLVSWRNPLTTDTDGIQQATWDDYIAHGVIQALTVAQEVSGQDQVNTLGFCVGGTLLATALAVLEARGESPAASMTLLTTLLDFHDTGVLKVFVNEAQAKLREAQFAQGGLLAARELGNTFAFLRPNDLVWNNVVNNYLKGEAPSAFDLLFWNADGTNLPGPFYAWYLRNTYLENNLKIPGKTTVCGLPLDLTTLSVPTYLYGSRDDHIVPWTSAFASTQLLKGPTRFVLGASGHIAGVINSPVKNRRNYWVNDVVANGAAPAAGADPQVWIDTARSVAGSWWPDWATWLKSHSGAEVKAKTALGNKQHPVIEAAPGRYVLARAM